MSNLNPGGNRSKGGRIFGASAIARHIRKRKPDHAADAENSLADAEHSHGREIARRLRQQARAAAKARGEA